MDVRRNMMRSSMCMTTGRLVYFSPTKTTKTVCKEIVKGIEPENIKEIDITTPRNRKEFLQADADDLVVIGVPVYMGRVPALITGWLSAMELHGARTVCVVVYGNRVYEDALLELTDIVRACGGIPVAGGAFIGEHSFSIPETPTAAGRPDLRDLSYAQEFGQKIREKMQVVGSSAGPSDVQVPGERPYRGDSTLWNVDFIAVNKKCIQCGICAEGCPAGAIDPSDSAVIDTNRCITCCACIRNCPNQAREMKPGLVRDASLRLFTLYHEPKTPEYFL